ncbi:UDP-N-acetylglucosamine 2-epimerase [Sulfurimonas sp. NW9]|uniref:UDP-N-acetylglucosamine 2-epimerase n=1 Tax=Sulfurimonas sp. NW9 TaxID=2922728 RepID=UPI003DA7D69B
MKRKIAVVTATRAEYGLLKPLLKEIENDDTLQLQLIVTGTHLEENFGNTYKEIEQEFDIDAKISMDLSCESGECLSLAMAQLQKDITEVLVQLCPDIMVILGDRYEMLSVATACLMLHIPLAHIHGGELTQGAIDDAIRHAITKLSHLHFTSTEVYAKRVIQMGEEPRRVFNVGSLGVQSIKTLQLLNKQEFEKSIGFKLGKKNLLVTYHPQTLSGKIPKEQFSTLLEALESLKETKIIFTKANADEGGQIINAMIDAYVKSHKNSIVFASLGQLRYFSALEFVDGVVGNSSSGILEVPSFKIPTLNIGERQEGRIQAKSIITVDIEANAIRQGLEKIYDPSFLESLKRVKNPYEGKEPSKKIKECLKTVELEHILEKKFYDVGGML